MPKLRGEEKKKFFYGMKSREWFSQVISACQMRALFKADNNDLRVVTKQKVNKLTDAITRIECYAHIYTQYLIRLMTEGLLPEKNDSGDIDFFLYATDDDHVVATNDKKWIALADAAGFALEYASMDTVKLHWPKIGDAQRRILQGIASCAMLQSIAK